jgi:hypothetical protein
LVHLFRFTIIIFHDVQSLERLIYQGSSKLYFVHNKNKKSTIIPLKKLISNIK